MQTRKLWILRSTGRSLTAPRLRALGAMLFAALLTAAIPTSDALATSLPAGYEITPISGSRDLSAYGASYCPGCGIDGEDEYYSNGESDGTAALGVWNEYVVSLGSSAAQDTAIATDELGGEMWVGLGGSGDNDGSAGFKATFSVPVAGSYAIEGVFDGFLDQQEISLVSDLGTVFEILYGFGSFRESFVLEPGRTYTLSAQLFGYDYSGTSSGGGITFALVPEPSTALCVGLGLVGMALARRRSIRVTERRGLGA